MYGLKKKLEIPVLQSFSTWEALFFKEYENEKIHLGNYGMKVDPIIGIDHCQKRIKEVAQLRELCYVWQHS